MTAGADHTALQRQQEAGAGSGTPAAPRRRGRPRLASPEDYRARITHAARQLFLERGYAGLTMDSVAAACQISKKTLYQFFASKVSLMASVVDAHRLMILALPGDYSALSPEDALAAIFRIDLGCTEATASIELLQRISEEARNSPELRAIVREIGSDVSQRLLAEWLDGEQAAGRLVVPDSTALAYLLMSIVYSPLISSRSGCVSTPHGTARQTYLRGAFRIIVDGIRPRP